MVRSETLDDAIMADIRLAVAEQIVLPLDEFDEVSQFEELGLDPDDLVEILFAINRKRPVNTSILGDSKPFLVRLLDQVFLIDRFPRNFGPQSTVADLRQLVVG
jgi:hypothetical protein